MALVALPSSEIWAAAGGQVAQIQFIHLLALGPCFVTINESFLNRAKPFPLFFSHPSGTVDLPHSPRKVWVWRDLQDHLVPSPCHGWGWPGCSMPLLGCHQNKASNPNPQGAVGFPALPSPPPAHVQIFSKSKDYDLFLSAPRRHQQHFESRMVCLCPFLRGTRTFPDHGMLPVLPSGWDKGRQHMCFAGERRWEFSRVKLFLWFMLN